MIERKSAATTGTQSPPAFSDPEDYSRFRSVLETAHFTDKGIIEALGINDFPSMRGTDKVLLLHRTRHATPLNTLVRLFLMEVPTDVVALRRAIEPMSVETWVEAGLIRIDGSLAIGEVKLLPFRDLLVAFDPDTWLYSARVADYVMGIGSSSLTLANLTIRRHAHLTLDLGTGCGIQALLAASHSDRVVALDRNPRAVQMAAFNVKLNGLPHVTCLAGDLFEPVKDRAFDLVVCNPPFVISPEMRYIYCDSGLEGDQICQKIVREAPQLLEENGFCQVLCNWAEYSGQDCRERLAGWFEGTGCDVWVLRSETRDVATYASTWIQHTERHAPEKYSQTFKEWLAYYESKGIEAVGAGLITMRRLSSTRNRVRIEDMHEKISGPCGQSILRGFELQDFLESVRDDSALLSTCFHVSPDVRMEQEYEPFDGGWAITATRFRLEAGITYSGNADMHVAKLLAACDGRQTLARQLEEMAASLGVNATDMRIPFLEIVRRLIERGLMLPPHIQP